VVQLSVVLKHLRKYRSDWMVDVRCGRGKHTALIGLCHRVYHDQEPESTESYDETFDLGWWEHYGRFPNCPNSKVTNNMKEVFGLDWDESLGRYQVNVGTDALDRARGYYQSIGAKESNGRFNVLLFHTCGNTSPDKKNLFHWQGKALADFAIHAGRIPVIFDWDHRSPLPDDKTIFCPRSKTKIGDRELWGEGWGSGDAEVIAALQTLAEAYIGIDSGPGKVASATETPTLICWMRHHPIQFHDPAANTTHLVPSDHRRMTPCSDDNRIADFFEKHYRFRTYAGEHGMVSEAKKWLGEVFGCGPAVPTSVQYVLPNGIGDVVWALMKIRAVAAGKPIDIILSGNPSNEIDHRSVPFLKRFDFIRNVTVMDLPVLIDREKPSDGQGRYRYEPDGVKGQYHYLVPNATLEAGKRLETWLPDVPIDWSIMDRFSWAGTERGSELASALKPFVAFYLGPERGNIEEGHNRGWQWEPKHWIELGGAIHDRGYNIAVVGATYDRSFWERYVKDGVAQDSQMWIDLIGKLEIGETLALLRRAALVVSYQCGLGICAHYLGTPVVMWWRREGDSVHPRHMISFSEEMRNAWVRPEYKDRYFGCIYHRQSVGDILAEIDHRGWLNEGQ
jgi:ADP-heptose:LPS heptosyltransferase